MLFLTFEFYNCFLLFVGSQSWFCQSNGEFDGSDPDRSDCVEDWIDDVYAKVIITILNPLCSKNKSFLLCFDFQIENKTIPALEIAREMETELLGTELSKKGLLLISQALDDLLSVRLLQVPNDTDVNYNYNFVNTFTGNQVKMFPDHPFHYCLNNPFQEICFKNQSKGIGILVFFLNDVHVFDHIFRRKCSPWNQRGPTSPRSKLLM